MRLTLFNPAWLFFALLLLVSCSKEGSFETNQSVGSLESLTGDCLPATVNGFYHTDSILGAAHNIDLHLNIITPGAYSISSDTVNGFYFKSAGFVDSSGLNTVRLVAKGKPAAAGDYAFKITYGASSCPLVVSVMTGPVAANAQYTVTTAGGACPNVTFAGTYMAGVNLNNTNTMDFDVNVTVGGAYAFNITTGNGITFAGTGVFTDVGPRHVSLKGSGKPVNAGPTDVKLGNCNNTLTVLPFNIPDAVYSINCAGASLNGTFMEKTAMTAQNTATIAATVTTPGKYNITTAAVNGVTFSATGTFTASSTSQTVTLIASGTPAAKGTFAYTVSGNGSTCKFAVPYVAAPAPAVFTLTGSPNSCSTPTVSGNYNKGIALDATNTVAVKVDVSTPGTYSLTTNTVNGIQFIGSGIFLNSGQQTVTLYGTGTPVAAGTNTFTFTPQFGNSSCSFSVTVAAPTVAPGLLTCKIDGVFTTFNDRAHFTHEPDIIGNIVLNLDGYVGPANGQSVSEFQMFVKNNNGSPVKAGSYNVDGYLLASGGYSISVDYLVMNPDQSGVRYMTASSIIAPNPPFTIVISSISATRVKGTFSGKITNALEGSTKTKVVTEGVFDLPIR